MSNGPEESASSRPRPQTIAEFLAGLEETPVEVASVGPTYAEEVSERVQVASAARMELVDRALEHHVPEAELRGLIADATNAGVLPRVFPGKQVYRGSGIELFLVDCQLQPEDIEVLLFRKPDGEPYPVNIGLNFENVKPTREGVISTGLLPNSGDAQPDHDMLQRIDSYMNLPAVE